MCRPPIRSPASGFARLATDERPIAASADPASSPPTPATSPRFMPEGASAKTQTPYDRTFDKANHRRADNRPLAQLNTKTRHGFSRTCAAFVRRRAARSRDGMQEESAALTGRQRPRTTCRSDVIGRACADRPPCHIGLSTERRCRGVVAATHASRAGRVRLACSCRPCGYISPTLTTTGARRASTTDTCRFMAAMLTTDVG